ncbi:MAG: helix-turn-helix domain-containing protein, partial [Hyphomonadaceae bacterium]|nr:helix-turn-helix domain-containing protein [Hyphomonadaceae bacterium]
MKGERTTSKTASDLDDLPLSDADLARMRRMPRVKIIRRALGLTQEEFAQRFQIPLGTLRDWEQGRSAPDKPAESY